MANCAVHQQSVSLIFRLLSDRRLPCLAVTGSVGEALGGPFEHLQDEAAAARRGIHAGTFKTPCEWRAEKAKREPRC